MSKEIDNSVFEKMFEKLYERYGKVNDDQDLIPIIYDKIQLSAEKAKEKGLPYLGNPRELANFVEKIRNGRPNYIKTVIVGDNPGKNEMKYGEFFSWKGLSGMALRNFFYRSLGRHRRCSDEIIPVREFWESEYKAIILNKTGYHTVSTGQLKDLKNDPDFIADQILWADLAEAIVATSEWMSTGEFGACARLLFIGFSELGSKKIFDAYARRIAELGEPFAHALPHFSMSQFFRKNSNKDWNLGIDAFLEKYPSVKTENGNVSIDLIRKLVDEEKGDDIAFFDYLDLVVMGGKTNERANEIFAKMNAVNTIK